MNYNEQNKTTDQQLVDSVLGNNPDAFRYIIKNTEGLVGQIVFKMISDPNDRKDIAQDIYIKVFQKLDGFKFQSKLSTWIAQIAYNTCINHCHKKKLVILDFNSAEITHGTMADPYSNETETLIFNKELSEILKVEIERLSPLLRTLITLFHNEELSYSEISEVTELPEGTVKSYLFRARKILRDNLLFTYKKDAL